jgi:hypothetical protein
MLKTASQAKGRRALVPARAGQADRYPVVRSQPAPFPRPHEVEPRPFRSAPTWGWPVSWRWA